MRHNFPFWMTAFLGESISFRDTLSPSQVPARTQKPDPLSLRWLAEYLEALADDPIIPLPTVVREKCFARIAAVRLTVDHEPRSAAWALRQVYNLIRHTVGA